MNCNYPKCKNEIREEDKKLKPQTAKLCEQHHLQFVKLTNENNIQKLTSFMMKIAFGS